MEEGIPLPTIVKKGLRAKDYKLYIFPPSVSALICNGKRTYQSISLTTLYDIVCIRAELINKPLWSVAQLVLATVSSTHIKRILRR